LTALISNPFYRPNRHEEIDLPQEIRERNSDLGYTLINANKMYFDRSLPLGQCMQVSPATLPGLFTSFASTQMSLNAL
jgi:hypothetical protein